MWCVYIVEKMGKYYTGITCNLKRRIHQHGDVPLLYFEKFPDKFTAARREKEIKGWSRFKKEKLIVKLSR